MILRRYLCRKCREDFQYESDRPLDNHLNSKHGFACGPVDQRPDLAAAEEIIATSRNVQIISWGKW